MATETLANAFGSNFSVELPPAATVAAAIQVNTSGIFTQASSIAASAALIQVQTSNISARSNDI